MVRLHEWELLANNTWHHNNTWIYKLTSKPLWCKILKPHFPPYVIKTYNTDRPTHINHTKKLLFTKSHFNIILHQKLCLFVCQRMGKPQITTIESQHYFLYIEKGVAFSLNTVWIIKDKIFTLQCVHWILVQVFTAIYKVLHINYTHNLETIACSSTTETAAVCLRGLHIVRIQQPMMTHQYSLDVDYIVPNQVQCNTNFQLLITQINTNKHAVEQKNFKLVFMYWSWYKLYDKCEKALSVVLFNST